MTKKKPTKLSPDQRRLIDRARQLREMRAELSDILRAGPSMIRSATGDRFAAALVFKELQIAMKSIRSAAIALDVATMPTLERQEAVLELLAGEAAARSVKS